MADLKVFRNDLERALISLDRDTAQLIVKQAVLVGTPIGNSGRTDLPDIENNR